MAEQTVGFFVSVETDTPCNMPNRSQTAAVHAMLVPVLFFFFATRAQTSAPLMVTQKKHRQQTSVHKKQPDTFSMAQTLLRKPLTTLALLRPLTLFHRPRGLWMVVCFLSPLSFR